MRTATQTKSTAPANRAKLSKKATRPVAPLQTKEAARTIGTTEAPKGSVPLKRLCAEIGINPKIARRELRKMRKSAIESKEQSALKTHDLHTRWFLSGKQLAEAKEVLKDYVTRNGKSK